MACWVKLPVFVGLWAVTGFCRAEVALDGSLGSAASIPLNNNTYLIDSSVGLQAGSNLFHSFGRFNLETGTTALFSATGANPISHIIARVTGGEASDIDGTIRSNIANADLFLINPSGLVFGPNAQLDVPGGFYASTASSVKLADGSEFSATSPNVPVLTTAAPVAFGFLDNAGAIDIRGSYLYIADDRNFHLSAADVRLQDAYLDGFGGKIDIIALGRQAKELPINGLADPAPGGELFLDNSVISNGSVWAGQAGDIALQGGDMRIEGSVVSTKAYGNGEGGHLQLQAENLLIDRSEILNETVGDNGGGKLSVNTGILEMYGGATVSGTTYGAGRGASIEIKASDGIYMQGYEALPSFDRYTSILAATDGTGAGGEIDIEASWLQLEQGTYLSVSSLNEGNAGNVHINADYIGLYGGHIDSNAYSSGQGGNLRLEGAALEIADGGFLSAVTQGSGNAGSIRIDANDWLALYGSGWVGEALWQSGIYAKSIYASGNAGDISIRTPYLEISDGAGIWAWTSGAGRGGSLTVDAADVFMSNGQIFVSSYGSGDAGRLQFGVDGNLSLWDRSYIHGNTSDSGAGASMDISAQAIELHDSVIQNMALTLEDGPIASGNSGDLTLRTQILKVLDGSMISSGTSGSGMGGNLYVYADRVSVGGWNWEGLPSLITTSTDALGRGGDILIGSASQPASSIDLFSGGSIAANALSNAGGNAGSVQIFADRINLQGRSFIASASLSASDAGTVTINNAENPGEQVNILDGSSLSVASNLGNAGDIKIFTGQWVYLLSSAITTSAADGFGNGGNILIDPQFVIVNDSQITANAAKGNGGNITIATQFFLPSAPSKMTASSQFGLQGTVSIQSQYSNIASSIGVLPNNLLDVSNLLNDDCAAAQASASSFTVAGRGALPLAPESFTFPGFRSMQCGVGL